MPPTLVAGAWHKKLTGTSTVYRRDGTVTHKSTKKNWKWQRNILLARKIRSEFVKVRRKVRSPWWEGFERRTSFKIGIKNERVMDDNTPSYAGALREHLIHHSATSEQTNELIIIRPTIYTK